jgi:hypothetical protein
MATIALIFPDPADSPIGRVLVPIHWTFDHAAKTRRVFYGKPPRQLTRDAYNAFQISGAYILARNQRDQHSVAEALGIPFDAIKVGPSIAPSPGANMAGAAPYGADLPDTRES